MNGKIRKKRNERTTADVTLEPFSVHSFEVSLLDFHEFTTMPFSQRPSSNRQSYNRIRFSVSCLDTDAGRNSEKIAKEKRERAQKSESTKKGNWLKCLPENVAHTVAINVENSTVMAPVSLYAITCVRIINPIAKRPYVPDGIKSVILWFYRSNSIRLSFNVCN